MYSSTRQSTTFSGTGKNDSDDSTRRPFGASAGILVLVVIGLVTTILSKFCVDSLLLKVYQARLKIDSPEKVQFEIERLPIFQDMKIKLKWSVLYQPISVNHRFNDLFTRGFITAISLTILCSITGYLGEINRWFEMTSHFKIQYLVIGFCCLFFFGLTRWKKWVMVSLFCILINLVEVVPWYFPSLGNHSINAAHIRVLQSNVLFNNQHYSQVISLVKQEKPDIAVFVEVSQQWAKELAVLQEDFPYSFIHQDTPRFGITIYSKLPLDNPSVKNLGAGRKTLVADVRNQGKTFSLIASHLSIPTSKGGFNLRTQQLVNLANYIATVKQPILAVGDWNITMWSPFYKRFVRETGLKNSRSGFGVIPSWPTTMPLLAIPIDQSLVSPEIKIVNIRTGSQVGSDHWPLITDLEIPVSTNG